MDLATTIFWIGVGLGAPLVGIGVIMMALSLAGGARRSSAGQRRAPADAAGRGRS